LQSKIQPLKYNFDPHNPPKIIDETWKNEFYVLRDKETKRRQNC